VTVQPQSRGALTFSPMISHYLVGEQNPLLSSNEICRLRSFKVLQLSVGPICRLRSFKVLQLSSDFDCHPIL